MDDVFDDYKGELTCPTSPTIESSGLSRNTDDYFGRFDEYELFDLSIRREKRTETDITDQIIHTNLNSHSPKTPVILRPFASILAVESTVKQLNKYMESHRGQPCKFIVEMK